MENARKRRNNKLVITERRWNYLVSEPNDYAKSFFKEYLLVKEKLVNN